MSDIETLDELKMILEISDDKVVAENRISPICNTNKENTPVGNAIIDEKGLERPQQQKQAPQKQQQQQQQPQHEMPQHQHQQQKGKPTKQKQQWTEMFNLTKVCFMALK